MKNIVNLSGCLAAALLLSVSACVKEPKPESPQPPALGWLLTKIVTTVKHGDPEGGPVYYTYSRDEYEYKHNKPWLHRSFYGEDSNNIVLVSADTISYDKKLRPIRKGVKPETGAPYELRYIYSGDDIYPATREYYTGGIMQGARKFLYQDTAVYEIGSHSDTTIHVYSREGNYLGIYYPDFYPTYTEYDNTPNPARYLNLSINILHIPESDYGPLNSTNNWLLNRDEFIDFRKFTVDTEGKVTRSETMHFAPGRLVTSVYYYTKPD